jgi:hypothetical protein
VTGLATAGFVTELGHVNSAVEEEKSLAKPAGEEAIRFNNHDNNFYIRLRDMLY